METNDTKSPVASPQIISIEEGRFVEVRGVPQWIAVRGRDRRNPPLLILTGPGAAFSRLAPFFAPWEEVFTLVQWDQPGSGATQAKNADSANMSLSFDRLAADAGAVAEFARQHLGLHKIAVLGISAGSITGLRIVKERPELFSAYIGTGQAVTWLRQEQLGYQMALEQARSTDHEGAVIELERIGIPPYTDAATDLIKSRYCGALTPVEQTYLASLDPAIMAAVRNPPADAAWIAPGLPVSDLRANAMACYEELRAEIFAFDAYQLGLAFDIPMFFFQGDQDIYTVTSEVESYAAAIRAPRKHFARIPGGGHSAFFLREGFLTLLKTHALPILSPDRRKP